MPGCFPGDGAGNLPAVTWGTTGHTPVPVPVFARGTGAESVTGPMENTDIFFLMMNSSAGSGIPSPAAHLP